MSLKLLFVDLNGHRRADGSNFFDLKMVEFPSMFLSVLSSLTLLLRQFNDTLSITEVNITERCMVRISLFVLSVTTLIMIQSKQGESGGKVTVSVIARKKKFL